MTEQIPEDVINEAIDDALSAGLPLIGTKPSNIHVEGYVTLEMLINFSQLQRQRERKEQVSEPVKPVGYIMRNYDYFYKNYRQTVMIPDPASDRIPVFTQPQSVREAYEKAADEIGEFFALQSYIHPCHVDELIRHILALIQPLSKDEQ